jgi:hypothetical protein
MEVHIELVARPTGVLTDVPGFVGLVDGLLYVRGLLEELAADVDVDGGGVHGPAGDEAAFDELVGVTSKDFTVLASARFAFIGVDDVIARSEMNVRGSVQARNRHWTPQSQQGSREARIYRPV